MRHRQSQQIHAKRRIHERYGRWLSNQQIEFLADQVRDGHGIRIKPDMGSRLTHAVEFEGLWMALVYDKTNHMIVTALPKSELFKAALNIAFKQPRAFFAGRIP